MESSNAVGRRRGETRGRDETQGKTGASGDESAGDRDRVNHGPHEQRRAERMMGTYVRTYVQMGEWMMGES